MYSLAEESRECPTTEALVAKGYLNENWEDPWGTPYQIVCEGEEIAVISAGSDRLFGTAQDIVKITSRLTGD